MTKENTTLWDPVEHVNSEEDIPFFRGVIIVLTALQRCPTVCILFVKNERRND